MEPRRLDFADHRRALGDNRYVYAVVSRRSRGLSIGINLNPDKVCNFDCPYCQVDRSTPGGSRAVDLALLEDELDHLLGLFQSGALWEQSPFDTAAPAFRRVHDIAFAGDGEPTSSPAFAGAVEVVGRLRARRGLQDAVRLHLLTNATLFHRPAVAAGIDAFHALGGQVWGKLDAGTEAWFHRVDGTTLPFDRVLANLGIAARRWRLVLQCLFVALPDHGGPDDAEIAAWARRIADLLEGGGRVEEVQVTTLARRPADPGVQGLSTARLEQIADAARALGLPVQVFPGAG
jgi:wyosine [tRNA(Phe)-imidazoG37] synthetase (radical SAM superfamily)